MELTPNMKNWLKKLYRKEAEDAIVSANVNHLCALGSNTDELAAMYQQNADEYREYARTLEDMIKELD